MTIERINIIIGLLIAIDVFQTLIIARLIYKDKKSEEVIKTNKIEMDGFEIKVENKELTVKQKK